MRLAAQLRGGYYPAPPEAIAFAATFLRLGPPAEGTQRSAKAAMGVGKIRLEAQRLSVARHRLRRTAEGTECIAEVAVSVGKIRPET